MVGIPIVQILIRYLSPFLLKINMDKHQKKLQKILKDKNEAKKSHETYMKRLKEKALEDNQLPTPSPKIYAFYLFFYR